MNIDYYNNGNTGLFLGVLELIFDSETTANVSKNVHLT